MVTVAHGGPAYGRQRSSKRPRVLTREERERIAPLYNPRSYSHYYGVSRDTCGRGWAAKVKSGLRPFGSRGLKSRPPEHLGYEATPQQAALLVAAYYERRFGPYWAEAVRSKYSPGRVTPYRIQLEPHTSYYTLTVWECGIEVRLKPFDDEYCLGFATQECAEDYLKRWVRERHGLFQDVALWRWAKLPDPGPAGSGPFPRMPCGLAPVPKCGWSPGHGRRSAAPPLEGFADGPG